MNDFDAPTIITTPPTRTVSAVMTEPPLGADNYQIGHEIARGGMGSILEAEDSKLKRTVAVKIMHLDANADASVRQRFLREAEVLAMLAHPNIVPIYDIVWEDGLPLFYSMKMVKGRTLQDILTALRHQEPKALHDYTLDRLLLIFRKICDALAFAHSKGVLHRDLKPENVMVGEFGEVLVMDWGLARRLGDHQTIQQGEETLQPVSLSLQTLQGSVMGTPQYMSPEQALGQIDELDERSDIFSLGGILYAILTLRPPVEGKTLEEVLSKVTSAEITSPSDLQTTSKVKGKAAQKGDVLEAKLIKPLPHVSGGRVPPALSSVVMKALRLEKERRYQNVAALSTDIEAYQGGFATSAEAAGALKQLKLLMLRHKAVTASLAALLIVSVGFVFKVLASERKATRHAEIAVANEQRANENAEQTRRALKTSQIAVAEAAYRTADLAGMVRALDSVPEDLRDQRWDYLSVKRDASVGEFRLPGFAEVRAVKAIPGQAGQFAIANEAGIVAIVDVRTGAVLRRIMTGLHGAMVLGVSDDGQRLAVTSRNAAEVKLYRVADGVAEKAVPSPSAAAVRLTFSPDAQQLVVIDEKGEVVRDSQLFLLDLRDGSVRWQYSGCYLNAIFSPDSSRLFIGSNRSRHFNVLDTETGNLISQTREYINCMALSRDRGRLAFGLYSGEVVIIDTATGTEKRRARLHLGGITHIAWTAGDHLLTIGNEAGFDKGRPVMRLWEPNSFSARCTFFGIKEAQGKRDFDFQPLSGHLLLLDSSPQLWRIPADVEAARLSSENAEQGWSTCFVSDNVLFSRTDYALQSFDVTNPRQPKALSFRSPPGYVTSAVHWPSGTAAVARRIDSAPHSIKLYQTKESKLAEIREIAMPDWTSRMDFDPAGKRLIATTTNQAAMVLDVSPGRTLLKLPYKIERAVFVGKDGEHIAAIVPKKRETDDVEDELTVFDAVSGKVLKSTLHHFRLDQLVASPDRKLIAIGGAEQVIRVLDAETLEERIDFRALDAEISALSFHPILPQLASASPDGSVKLWDYQTAKLQHTFLGFDGTPVMLAFSPNGKLLSVEAQERTARLFDLSGESAPAAVKPAVRAPFPVVGKDWLGLINELTEDDIIDEGRGWRRENGALYSPDRGPAVLPLPVNLSSMSYQIRLQLRQLVKREVLHLILPVGDRMVGFDLDGAPFAGYTTGLVRVDGKFGKNLPGTLLGKQIKDNELHAMEVTVQLKGSDATITTRLDDRPFHEWTGSVASLETIPYWASPPGRLAIGAMSADWTVTELMVRRLD